MFTVGGPYLRSVCTPHSAPRSCAMYPCVGQQSLPSISDVPASDLWASKREFFIRSSTTSSTMSPPNLPPELLDHIADFLCDSSDALKSCCLVSKSWIPAARKHLFADIQFRTIDDLESWEAIFPDPSASPAHYTKTLFGC